MALAVNSPTTPILPIGLCNDPFADADDDHDVDMDDFGAFQACYTGQTDLIAQSSCRCFDRNGDNHVEEQDFNAFRNCANRAGLLADLNCDGL